MQTFLLSDPNTACEKQPSDMRGWVIEHDENSAMLFEKPGLSDELMNEFFSLLLYGLIRTKNAEHHLTSNEDKQYALPTSLLHSLTVPTVPCYLVTAPNNFSSPFTETPIIIQFLSD